MTRKAISFGDKVRIALSPLHLLLGGLLIGRFIRGERFPMVLVLGLLFCTFGIYRLKLIIGALRRHMAS